MVDGYAIHLNARKELSEAGGGVGLVPSFTDLVMWAVLAGEHDLAQAQRWTRTPVLTLITAPEP